MGETKALTIRQPWASLIACGPKTIETRSWATNFRGPLLIHAGMHRPEQMSLPPLIRHGSHAEQDAHNHQTWHVIDTIYLPLGAVVAVCTLADVVPIIVGAMGDEPPAEGGFVYADTDWLQVHDDLISAPRYSEDEIHYGDYRSGRYAWLLADVRPLTSPVPAKGRQGLWTPDADLIQAVEAQR